MAEKPELIAIGQFCLGGVLSFYENLLTGDGDNIFDKKIILLNALDQHYPKPVLNFPDARYEIFDFSYEQAPGIYASALQHLISDRPGVVLTNFLPELAALHLYRKPHKTVVYICHDELYLERAAQYSFLIEAYIAHNPAMFERLRQLMPDRTKDIHYIPYGISPAKAGKKNREDGKLGLVFLARHIMTKGILDIPKINRLLAKQNIPVEWTIFGDGKESPLFREEMREFDNVTFTRYEHKEELYGLLATSDLMIHPSSLDGLPVAMLEAMSAGVVPIVYEFNEGIRKVLINDSGVVVPVGDYEDIVRQVSRFYHDRPLLGKFSSAARTLIMEQYEVSKQSALYYQLFRKYLSVKRPRKKKFINYYKGWSNHPAIPTFIRFFLKRVKKLLKRNDTSLQHDKN